MRLTKTRRPEPGFAEAAFRWASGERLERVLERSALSPGDFVRNAKQLADLLRQVSQLAQLQKTAETALRPQGPSSVAWSARVGSPRPDLPVAGQSSQGLPAHGVP